MAVAEISRSRSCFPTFVVWSAFTADAQRACNIQCVMQCHDLVGRSDNTGRYAERPRTNSSTARLQALPRQKSRNLRGPDPSNASMLRHPVAHYRSAAAIGQSTLCCYGAHTFVAIQKRCNTTASPDPTCTALGGMGVSLICRLAFQC
jgi:hypothetical protein